MGLCWAKNVKLVPMKKLLLCWSLVLPLFSLGNVENEKRIDSLLKVLAASPEDTNKVYLLTVIGKEYSYTGQRDSLLSCAKQAVALAEKLNYIAGLSSAYGLFANYYFHEGDYSRCLDYNLKSLKLNEQLGNKRGIFMVSRNIGSLYINSNNNEKALEYFEKALEVAIETKATKEIGSIYSNMAIVYHKKTNYGKAMEYNLKSLKYSEEAGDIQTQGYVYNSLGKLFHDMGMKDENPRDLDKAIEYLSKALKMKREQGDLNAIANTLGNIAEVYMDKGDRKKALECFLEGLEYAEKTNFKRWLLEGYEDISTLYRDMGDYKSAYDYYVKFRVVKDSIEGATSKKVMAELQGKYDTEKNEKTIQLLSKDNDLNQARLSKQRYVIVAVAVGLIAVLSLAFFIYRGSREKQRINNIIEEKNKSITDSIHYAKRIQTAILPKEEEMRKTLKEYFVFYRPKDIVSGDFYFYAESRGRVIVAVADCTGHGVPGAFMSMIGNSLLSKIIKENGLTKPSEILSQLNSGVKEALKQHESGSDTRDGMDIALCSIDIAGGKMEFAGANRSLLLVRGTEATEVKADKVAIGGLQTAEQGFTNHDLSFSKGDMIYLNTDGYADQFGGGDGKKFRTRRFRELLAELSPMTANEQGARLESILTEWMGLAEQLDDILVIGIRL